MTGDWITVLCERGIWSFVLEGMFILPEHFLLSL